MKMYSSELFSLMFLREKFENTLEISGNLVFQKCGHPGNAFIDANLIVLLYERQFQICQENILALNGFVLY